MIIPRVSKKIIFLFTTCVTKGILLQGASEMYVKHIDLHVNRKTALKGSKALMRSAGKVLNDRYGTDAAAQILEGAEKEFAALIPVIPYVGGRRNFFSDMPIKAAVVLALYRALQIKGVSLKEFGIILEAAAERYMNSLPSWVRNLAGKLWMSRLFRRILIKQSKISQQRNYQEDFVYDVVPGSGNHIWGIDYLECGITKFLETQGEPELAKYACILDFVMFPSIGVVLERTGTIAQGCDRCDFRFTI